MFVQIRNLLIFLTIFLLTACGGGGSSNNVSVSFDEESVYTLDPDKVLQQAKRVGSSRPKFGSITQSSNQTAGTTSDTASTSFNGSNLSLSIRKGDGSTLLTLNSASNSYRSNSFVSPVSGHDVGRTSRLLTSDNNSLSASIVTVSWDSQDPTDYIAGGYWLHLDLNSQQVSNIEVGAFVDGPELNRAPTIPSGTATYRGEAAGLFVVRAGSDYPVPGTIDGGRYSTNDLSLTANFSARTISGCAGCNNGFIIDAFSVAPNGVVTPYTQNVNARMVFGSASINSEGEFVGGDMTFSLNGITASSTNGYWGGKFSATPDADGDPRLVAGTNGANFRLPDGSEGSLVGAFYGVKQ